VKSKNFEKDKCAKSKETFREIRKGRKLLRTFLLSLFDDCLVLERLLKGSILKM
jgi:hypothetical protein